MGITGGENYGRKEW
jgi:hypothetical protein